MEDDNFEVSVRATFTPIDGKEVDLEVDEYVQGSARALIHLLDMATDFTIQSEGALSWSFIGDIMETPLQRALRESEAAQELTRNDNIQIKVDTIQYEQVETKVESCGVCTEEFETTSTVSVLSCQHIFHEECVREWGHYNQSCPLCRASIPIIEQEEKSE